MQRVWGFIKLVVVLGVLGWVGYFVYTKSQEGPPVAKDVYEAAEAIAQIVGDEKTELTTIDKPSVEFQVEKIRGATVEQVKKGLALFDPSPSRAEFVACELVMLFVYPNKAQGYVSRIEGEPWEVSGDLVQMSLFNIDRTVGDADSVKSMLAAYGDSVQPRAGWN